MFCSSLQPSAGLSRRFLARLLSTLLCSVLVVLRPFSALGGSTAFLALTIKELHFSAQQNLAQQVEALVLHLLGGLLGIGASLLANYIASLSSDTVTARAIPAIFLTAISFSAGWLKSALPRLTLSSRIACFVSIWLLTSDPGAKNSILEPAAHFLWIILTGAITSLCACFLLLHWSTAQIADDISLALTSLHDCLQANLERPFAATQPSFAPVFHTQLLRQAVALNHTYHQATFELRIGRVSVKSLKPFIGTIEHLRREISWGMTFPHISQMKTTPSEIGVVHSFREPALELGNAISDCITVIRSAVLTCYDVPSLRSMKFDPAAIIHSQTRLSSAVESARDALKQLCDELDKEQRISSVDDVVPQKTLNLCLFMISLLQMANETVHALKVARAISDTYKSAPYRLWYPRLSWAWLGVASTTIVLEERGTLDDISYPPSAAVSHSASELSPEEALRGVSERHREIQERMLQNREAKARLHGNPLSLRWFRSVAHYMWNLPILLRARFGIHKISRAARQSSHLKHAFKNAVGVSLLALPAFLSSDSRGRQWFIEFRGQWMIISYVWVLETNTGATLRVAYLRLSGTIVGATYAFIASVISHTNPFGLVAFTTIAEIPVSWIIIHSTFPSLGVVANVTLPPIIFASYFDSDSPPAIRLALIRGIMIAAGVIAALLMNGVVYPRHCRVMFLDSARTTIGSLTHLYLGLSKDLFQYTSGSGINSRRKMVKLEFTIRNALQTMNLLITTMEDELSLIPIPMTQYRRLVASLQKLLDIMTGLRKIREHIPRQETVIAVADQRREFVSCICVSLFACEQVFGARQPLPQFLPSYRKALQNLVASVRVRVQARGHHIGSPGLSLIYSLAETDALTDMVDTIDELLELSRRLFGTASWFNVSPLDTTAMISMHEEIGSSMSAI